MTRKKLLTLRVDLAELINLDQMAELVGVSRSEMFRRAIDAGLAQMQQERFEAEVEIPDGS